MIGVHRPGDALRRGGAVAGGIALGRSAQILYLVQQGDAGRQIHLLLFVSGQLFEQRIDLTELGLDLLAAVCRDAAGQCADQLFDGADPTGGPARCAGLFWDIATDIVMRVGTGQRSNDAAAVLCAHMGARDGSVRPRIVVRGRAALVRMGVDTVRSCRVAVIIMVVGTSLFRYRWDIPALLRMRRMMWAQSALCPHVSGRCPQGAKLQAQRQSDDRTQCSAFHAMTSQIHEGAAVSARSPNITFLFYHRNIELSTAETTIL